MQHQYVIGNIFDNFFEFSSDWPKSSGLASDPLILSMLDIFKNYTPPQFSSISFRDFPKPDLGRNIGSFPIEKKSKNLPK